MHAATHQIASIEVLPKTKSIQSFSVRESGQWRFEKSTSGQTNRLFMRLICEQSASAVLVRFFHLKLCSQHQNSAPILLGHSLGERFNDHLSETFSKRLTATQSVDRATMFFSHKVINRLDCCLFVFGQTHTHLPITKQSLCVTQILFALITV